MLVDFEIELYDKYDNPVDVQCVCRLKAECDPLDTGDSPTEYAVTILSCKDRYDEDFDLSTVMEERVINTAIRRMS
jgi:hypothetical protein